MNFLLEFPHDKKLGSEMTETFVYNGGPLLDIIPIIRNQDGVAFKELSYCSSKKRYYVSCLDCVVSVNYVLEGEWNDSVG